MKWMYVFLPKPFFPEPHCTIPNFLHNALKPALCTVTSRNFHSSCKSFAFWEPHPKGEKKYDQTKPVFTKKNVAEGLRELRPEFEKWVEEMRELFRGDKYLFPVPDDVVDVFAQFDGPASLQNWVISCDSDFNEGFSTAELTSTSMGYGRFSGNLSTRLPKDGRIKAAGWCNLRAPPYTKSFHRPIPFPFELYTHLVLRLRGDGRTYIVNMHTPSFGDVTWLDTFTYPLFTRGGPYWQITKIPFAKFVQQYRGRVQHGQSPLPRDNVKAISITIADRNNGPFNLEIDYIGAERIGNPDPDETVYEGYDLPIHLAS